MLHAQKLEAAHSGDYLAQVTTDMLAGWHLHKDRVQYVLRDNGTAMVKAMRVTNLPNIGCMAHTLHRKKSRASLCLADALSDTSNIGCMAHTLHRKKSRASLCLADALSDTSNIGCMAHTLQLVVKDVLESQKEVESVVVLGRRIVGHFKHSTLAYNRLMTFQKVHQLPEHRLIQDQSCFQHDGIALTTCWFVLKSNGQL